MPELDKLPEDLPHGPMREAMELAKEASFSVGELEAYRKVMDEIQQARDYGETKKAEGLTEGHKSGLAEGHKSGLAEGHKSGVLEGKRDALTRLVTRLNIELSDEERARIAECNDAPTLDRWFDNTLAAKTAADVFA
ncbi:MAG TPA: hypothetical protein PK156_17670 [Polyangium sp.]|nr:hypothetical protein [Polyangium sp.]